MPAVKPLKPNKVFVSGLEAAADGSVDRLRRSIRSLHGTANFRGWEGFELGTPHHRTLLMAAAHSGQPACVELLIEAGAELDTALPAFAHNRTRRFYEHCGPDAGTYRTVSYIEPVFVSALALAVSEDQPGHIECTALLIAAGADPSATGLEMLESSHVSWRPGELQLCILVAAGCQSDSVLKKARQLPWLSRMQWSQRGKIYTVTEWSQFERLCATVYVLNEFPDLEPCLLTKHPDLLNRAATHYTLVMREIGQASSMAEWVEVARRLWGDPLLCSEPTRAAVWTLRMTRAGDRIAAAKGRARSVFGCLPGPIMIMIQEWVRLLSLPRCLRIGRGLMPALQDQANMLRDQWRARHV